MDILAGDKFGMELLERLGISYKLVYSILITIKAQEPIKITISRFADKDEADWLLKEIECYQCSREA